MEVGKQEAMRVTASNVFVKRGETFGDGRFAEGRAVPVAPTNGSNDPSFCLEVKATIARLKFGSRASA